VLWQSAAFGAKFEDFAPLTVMWEFKGVIGVEFW
jgi:hypothetical protein